MRGALLSRPAAASPLTGHAYCERVTRDKAKSFYFASAFLPAEKRRGIFALYHFCRHLDDLVDERGDRPVEAVRDDLAEMVRLVKRLHLDAPPDDALWHPLHEVVRRHDVPLEPLLDLIEGVSRDLHPQILGDTPDLLEYCYLVAGVVGLMIGPVLGGAEKPEFREAGVALGNAMQLTNVLRDVAPDFAEGRVYLPASELARYGLGHEDLARGVVTPEWRAFMAFQIERARRMYERGDEVVGLFPNDGSRLTVRMMQRTYAGILDAIERRDYDVFSGRAHVGTLGKVGILARVLATGAAFR